MSNTSECLPTAVRQDIEREKSKGGKDHER